MQVAAEIAQRLHTSIQTGILTLLRTARPHPVGTQTQRIHSLSQRCTDDIRQRLGYREYTSCCGISQTGLRSMTKGGGDTLLSTIVEGHNTTVAQWQLNLSLTLLTGNLTSHRTVYLVCQPVLTSHSLKLEHALEVLVNLILCICYVFVMALYSIILHDGLRRVTKHLSDIEIKWLHTITLLE